MNRSNIMRIWLKELTVKNYGGVKNKTIKFGQRTVISGPNGAGKTTIQSAVFWLLYDKTVDQRSQFGLRPVDQANRPLPGLVVHVQAVLNIDGTDVTLCKENHERIVNQEAKGTTNKYWVDEVSMKEGEYNQYINSLANKEVFRMLTDLFWFCSGLHWQERRQVLLDMAGDIGTPQGYDDLQERLKGRTIQQYTKVLKDRRKGHINQRDQILPRMDEVQQRLSTNKPTGDKSDLEAKRTEVQGLISSLTLDRLEVVAAESTRQAKIEKCAALRLKRSEREMTLRKELLGDIEKERYEFTKNVLNLKSRTSAKSYEVEQSRQKIEQAKYEIAADKKILTNINETIAQKQSETVNEICSLCSQKLPKNMLEKYEQEKTKGIQLAKKKAFQVKSKICEKEGELTCLEEEHEKVETDYEELKANIKKAEKNKLKRLEELAKMEVDMPEPDFRKDKTWAEFTTQLDNIKSQVGEPVTEQLKAIDDDIEAKRERLDQLNAQLNDYDNLKKDTARLEELKQERIDVSQLIANIERELDEIKAYNVQVSLEIEMAVNSKFKDVKWRLFDYLMDGEINDNRCEATYNGVAFIDLSTGEQHAIGLSVINTLSEHYGKQVPLFIDHDESIGLPLDSTMQLIKLRFDASVEGLSVRREKK